MESACVLYNVDDRSNVWGNDARAVWRWLYLKLEQLLLINTLKKKYFVFCLNMLFITKTSLNLLNAFFLNVFPSTSIFLSSKNYPSSNQLTTVFNYTPPKADQSHGCLGPQDEASQEGYGALFGDTSDPFWRWNAAEPTRPYVFSTGPL